MEGTNEIKINKKLISDEIITIEFHNQNIKSPKELGMSEDARNIKLGLGSIELITLIDYDV